MLNNDFKIGKMDTLVAYYDRNKNIGTINATETISAHIQVRAAILQGERWKATDNKDDIQKTLVLQMRYSMSIYAEKTVIVYNSFHYKVRDIEIIGRRQFIKVTAIQDQE